MELGKANCSICSKEITSGNLKRQKLLQTPCHHLFHRTCLKNWFRREPAVNCCPKRSRSLNWNEVTCWSNIADETKRNTRDRKQEANCNETAVASLAEELRNKKAEEYVKKRRARKCNSDTLDGYRRQEILQQQRESALQRQCAKMKSQVLVGEERRQRIKLLKRVFFGFLSRLLFLSMSVGAYKFLRNMNPTFNDRMDNMTKFCFGKLEQFQDLDKEAAHISQILETSEELENPDKNVVEYLKAKLERMQIITERLGILLHEIDHLCIPLLEKGMAEAEQKFILKNGKLKDDAWSRKEFNTKQFNERVKATMQRFAATKKDF